MFFYLKMARLGFIEWSGSRSGLLAFCLFYAFWFWLWSRLLLTLAEPSATWGRQGLLLYIGLTQIIAGTALQGTAISEAMADFSAGLLVSAGAFLSANASTVVDTNNSTNGGFKLAGFDHLSISQTLPPKLWGIDKDASTTQSYCLEFLCLRNPPL
ncbi:MAG: hypothetical protein AB2989_01260 [Candidatus Symbiodolus clandestinus]